MSDVQVQLYSDGLLRGFVGNVMLFEITGATYRELDAMGLPRIGKPKTSKWKQREWGFELIANFSAKTRKPRD